MGGGKARVRNRVFARDGNKCVNCGSKEDLTIDHLNPKSKGGRNTIWNLATMCSRCNEKKGNRLMHKWLRLMRKQRSEWYKNNAKKRVKKTVKYGCRDCEYTCESQDYCYVCKKKPEKTTIIGK